MAEVASKYSDYIIVTDDNPRNENPQKIRRQILDAIINQDNVIEIADRKNAIIKALNIAKQDDIILIVGKGHEKYQIIGNEKHFFSDSDIVKDFIIKLYMNKIWQIEDILKALKLLII